MIRPKKPAEEKKEGKERKDGKESKEVVSYGSPPSRAQLAKWSADWASFFQDHMDVIYALAYLLRLPDRSLLAVKTQQLHARWRTFTKTSAADQSQLIKDSADFKNKVFAAVKASPRGKCYSDLLPHMKDELVRFSHLRTRVPCLQEAIVDWSEEHATGELFVACIIPLLVKVLPASYREVIRKNTELASLFEKLGRAATNDTECARDFLRLSSLHMASASTFLQEVLPTLDISSSQRDLLRQILEHESKEAKWAHAFIASLASGATM